MRPEQARHACVVGAGIVGCATAYALAREGWRITLVDALQAPGQGASFANGAQLSYSYVEPMATPAALRALPGWLLSPSSPLRWRPRAEIAHLRWLAAFIGACRTPEVARTTEALLSLSFLSRETLHRWFSEQPGLAARVNHARPGKLVIQRAASARAGVQRQLAVQGALGCEQRLVEADECIAIEPALAAQGAASIAFGIWTASEEVVDAALLSQALAKASGAEMRLGVRALGFDPRQGTLQLESGERIEADQFVVATGSGAQTWLRELGLSLPIEPIKGYSVTLPIVDAAAAPRVSITDQGRKIVYARLGESLRVAGFAELVGADSSVAESRIAALCAALQATFPGACDLREPHAWAGLRPATPHGRPLVGATAWPNLWVNTGHGGLGLTLAAGSAAMLAGMLGGRAAEISTQPYAP